ncbi:MAG TPA: sugar-binding domain-containing protein [Jatrophihabitans sp.]|jgi:DNA-binding transcriptional regulator LsrR (DeoR family)|nr:sugar-binding domain-containing protein [Jatrophihabitans sp.]
MAPSSTELILMARVARHYYHDDRSKSDIADELGISRFRVARLLDAAKRAGIVTIRIETPAGIDTELSVELQRAYGLAHAVVIDVEDDEPESLRRRLGEVAADVLQDVVGADDVLGLAWARSLRGIGPAVTSIAGCPVVQLTGALSGPDGSDVLELVRRVAHAGGGTPHVFYAPLVAPDAASARALRRQPEVARAAELADKVTVAAVGIGAWEPGLSTIYDMVDGDTRERARALGTVGEISGALIGADGAPVRTPLSRRIIGVTGEQLAGIRTVISVAYGKEKAGAVGAALRGGLVNGLITHAGLARVLLEQAELSGDHER